METKKTKKEDVIRIINNAPVDFSDKLCFCLCPKYRV